MGYTIDQLEDEKEQSEIDVTEFIDKICKEIDPLEERLPNEILVEELFAKYCMKKSLEQEFSRIRKNIKLIIIASRFPIEYLTRGGKKITITKCIKEELKFIKNGLPQIGDENNENIKKNYKNLCRLLEGLKRKGFDYGTKVAIFFNPSGRNPRWQMYFGRIATCVIPRVHKTIEDILKQQSDDYQ